MKDLFVLKNSDELNVTTQGNYPASLTLTEAGDQPYQLSGTVTNAAGGAALPGAYVAVYDSTGAFVAGDYVDDGGEYAVELPVGTNYEAVASATGFAPADSFTFSITDTSVTNDFTLTAYTDEDRVIYGKVFEPDGTTAVGGARIDVVDSTGTVVATTASIADGEYAVPDLALGDYSLVVSKAGYNIERQAVSITAGSTLVEADVTLTAFTEPTGSTISGFITRADTTGIANAWVGLYSSPLEALEQTTTTNADGYYCFENLPAADYVVKAKAVEQ